MVASLLKLPTGLPEAPPGDHAHVEVRRAAKNFLAYRLLGLFVPQLIWGGAVSVALLVVGFVVFVRLSRRFVEEV